MVSLDTADVAVLLLYAAAVLAVGYIARRRGGAGEFLLAGRTLTLPVFVMTLVSTWYGGILGVGEFSYRYGITNWFVQGVPYYLFALVFALVLAGRVRASGLVTIPDKLREAYGPRAGYLGAFLTFLLMTPAPYVLMLGVLLQAVTGWGFVVCLLGGTAVTVVMLFVAGFRADVYTDILEFGVMFGGFAVLLPFAVSTFGGWSYLTDHLPPMHLTWHGGNPPQYIAVWFLIALWTLVDPAFHQRCYAAASPAVARRGILLAIPCWFVFDAMTASAGLYARAALPGLAQPVMAYPALAEAVLPPVAKGVFVAGMLATIMSTLNSLVFIAATSLGRDMIWRFRGSPDGKAEVRLTRVGLLAASLLALVLAILIPSVIDLWYMIGTAIIPGLLVPLVTSYFERWKVGPGYAFATMAAGWGTAMVWLGMGVVARGDQPGFAVLGIEPMFPGLVVSLVVWALGMRARTRISPA